MEPLSKPLLIFDGDCNFCRRSVERWRQVTGETVDYAPYQEAAARFPAIPEEDFIRGVVLVEPDGSVFRGADAVLRSRTHAGRGRVAWWAYRRLPGFAAASERAYRLVARNRHLFSRITRLLWGRQVERPSYKLVRWLFLRALALVYLAAFLSLWVQIDGLVGSEGILPLESYLEGVRENVGERSYRLVPTLVWLDPGDGFLHLLCGAGTVLSLVLLVGAAPRACLAALWVLYLSLTLAGQDFLQFQWDILLLETGLLAVLLAPGNLLPGLRREAPPSMGSVWLLRFLLFKLMFMSGLVKLWGGDETWWSLTAMDYHYWTTCLPTWTGWYVHHLPASLHRVSVALMFGVELVVPFLIFLPRRLRILSFFPQAGLQAGIMATGNYGFFNLNALALCLLLLDDASIRRWIPARMAEAARGAVREGPLRRALARTAGGARTLRAAGAARRALGAALVAVLLILSGSVMLARFRGWDGIPGPIRSTYRWLRPVRSINGYGLFASMTTTRREIVLEGSMDGRTWTPYEFKWKPGDPARRPGFVQPHMPRLDWQMWFAALGSYQRNTWFVRLMVEVLEGSPPVLDLLETNPFPEEPPRYLRAVIFDYHFTDPETRKAEGTWWRRELLGLYAPVLTRDERGIRALGRGR